MPLTMFPALNASLNAASAVLLLAGFGCIRAGRWRAHAGCMVSACVVSLAFLASYLCYHAQVGSVRFPGTGAIRPLYFTVLISHTILAVVIVPMVIRTLWLALRRRLVEHRALARWTFPLWLYVSVTGVLVYWMLYRMPVAEACPACKDMLVDPEQLAQRLGMAKGFAWSIGLLIGMPALLVGALTVRLIRAHRHRRQT